MFGLKRKKPLVLDVEASIRANAAMHAYEVDGDPSLLYAMFGDDWLQFFPQIKEPVAAVAAGDDPSKEGK